MQHSFKLQPLNLVIILLPSWTWSREAKVLYYPFPTTKSPGYLGGNGKPYPRDTPGWKWLLGVFPLHFFRPGLREKFLPLPRGSLTLLATRVKDENLGVNGRTPGRALWWETEQGYVFGGHSRGWDTGCVTYREWSGVKCVARKSACDALYKNIHENCERHRFHIWRHFQWKCTRTLRLRSRGAVLPI